MAEVLSGRAGPAGVRWALLSRPVKNALRAELGKLLDDAYGIDVCRLRRAKFKPGRKLTAYYDVAVRRHDTGAPQIRPIAVTWLPQGTGAGEPSPELAAMQMEALDQGLAAPFRQLASELPARGMRLQVSPLDARFPQLVRLSDPRYVREMLATSAARGDHLSPKPVVRYDVTPVRYRPGQRHVLLYEPENDANGAIFAKLYTGGNGARFRCMAEQVADSLAASGKAGLSAVRPQAYIAGDDVILYPRVAGRTLTGYLRQTGRDVAPHLRQAGIMLRALHDAGGTAAELEPHDFHAEAKLVARAAEHVQTLLPSAGATITMLIERARALYAGLPGEPPTLTHSDFKADHLWVTRAGLTLIDFDACRLADPALDVGKFLADLRWWHVLFGRPGLEQAQMCFLEGYGRDVPRSRLERAQLYEVLWLVKTTVRRVPLFDPDWAGRTGQLIGRAEAALHSQARASSA